MNEIYLHPDVIALIKLWLENHSFSDIEDSSEYQFLCFHLGDLKAYEWFDYYIGSLEDLELENILKEVNLNATRKK